MARSTASRPRFGWILVAAGGVLALGWGAFQALEAARFQSNLAQARLDADAERFEDARVRLKSLADRWPRQPEVEYLLGGVEAALGRIPEALDTWNQVPDDAEQAEPALFDRARLALQHGRLAVAEESLDKHGRLGGTERERKELASKLSDQLDLYLGDSAAIGRRIEQRWKTAPDQAMLLRTHWLLDTQPYPVEPVRESLDRMALEADGDDRLQLAQAHLEIELGRFDEADSKLSACEAKRPNDPRLAETRLRWALAAGRPEAALVAASKLPADRFSPAEIAGMAASLSRLRGETEAERASLRERVALEPGDAAAWERLAELSSKAGLTLEETEARRRKGEIDQAKDHYRTLMGKVAARNDLDLVELAQTAETLGRRFEAQSWWSLLARQPGAGDEARLAFTRLALGPTPKADKRPLNELFPKPGTTHPKPLEKVAKALNIPTFEEAAEKAGLKFTYDNDPSVLKRLPETMGGGIGLIDYDNDGFLDVYAVQGGQLVPSTFYTSPQPKGDKLFRNLGNGTFDDVTERAGLTRFEGGYGHGVTVGDFDNDGLSDLFITRWRSYALYRNLGNGTFEDATEKVGLGGPRGWPTSAAFGDLDNDGDLDLYVCQYLEYDPVKSAPCQDPDRLNHNVYCVPKAFKAEPDRLYRNDGGKFTDVTAESGIVDEDGRGLGVVLADLDADGLSDIYVANDMSANFLFRNLGNLHFEEIGQASGVASNGDGGFQAGMGLACGDLDGDGLPELAVTNFHGESTTFFQNLGKGLFADRTAANGLAGPTRYVLGFGAAFLDANNDGHLDLAQANGHVNDYRPAIPYAMPSQLFLNLGDGKLSDVSNRAGACWQKLRVGRGLAVGDLDNDNRLDLLILSQGSPLAYFRNLGVGESGDPSRQDHAITLQLVGKTTNRDGVGTKILIKANGRSQVIQRLGGGSFLSASDGRVHIGLGTAKAADLEVQWTNGKVDRFQGLKADMAYQITEGEPVAKLLKGWTRP